MGLSRKNHQWRTLQHQPVVEEDSVVGLGLVAAAGAVVVDADVAGVVVVGARMVTRSGSQSPSWAVWLRT